MAKSDRNASGETSKSANVPEEGQANIVVGEVYKEDNGDAEVIPYFVDFSSARVNFAGVGRSNEDQMRTSDFLNRFTHVGPVSSQAEEQTSNDARLSEQKAARDAEARAAAKGEASRKTGV